MFALINNCVSDGLKIPDSLSVTKMITVEYFKNGLKGLRYVENTSENPKLGDYKTQQVILKKNLNEQQTRNKPTGPNVVKHKFHTSPKLKTEVPKMHFAIHTRTLTKP